ncbi:piggyBac transposable element-derived protein 5 [Puma concolor]|uniref:PiggyBac transposable element-derived protein 5 n=1 Tax=Puma concolor TaxID=9696 RepID=A0A6P6H508_PUMCO|nr:piggyBac transposable element-derived protein 5 [Puma concolor]
MEHVLVSTSVPLTFYGFAISDKIPMTSSKIIQDFLFALRQPDPLAVLHEPLIDEDPVFIATCTERELRKRKKRKFSLWVRQCSSTGFIIQIYVHLKEGGGPDGLDALKNKPQLHSMVARSLCRNAAGKNYIIFTGPSITSLTLFEELEKQGVIIKRKTGEIPCPLAVEAFAAHLSYICKYDDKYSKYFISHKPNKTWQQVFWFAISIAINNAYILYKMSDAYHVKRSGHPPGAGAGAAPRLHVPAGALSVALAQQGAASS